MADYWDIDDILAEAQDIHCQYVFDLPARNLGYLNPENTEEDLPPNSRLILPYWLARYLADHPLSFRDLYGDTQTHLIMILAVPPCFSTHNKDLIADPVGIDLNYYTEYYYVYGLKILSSLHPSALLDTLSTVMNTRYREMMTKTSSSIVVSHHQHGRLGTQTLMPATLSNTALHTTANSSAALSFLSTPSLAIYHKYDHTEREMLAKRLRGWKGYEWFTHHVPSVQPGLSTFSYSSSTSNVSATIAATLSTRKHGTASNASHSKKRRYANENDYHVNNADKRNYRG